MQRIRRYLLKEVLVSFLAVSTVLVVIFTGVRFIRYLGDAAHGRLPAEVIFQLLFVVSLGSLGQVLPFAIFTAMLIAFGRLYKDNEMTILSACGVGQRNVIGAMMMPISGVVLLTSVFSFYLNPLLMEMTYQIKESADSSTQIAGLKPGTFTVYGDGRYTFYVEQLKDDQRALSHIFLQAEGEEGEDVFVAPEGRRYTDATGAEFMELKYGYRYYRGKDAAYQVYQYETAMIRLPSTENQALTRKQRAMPTEVLLGSDTPEDVAEMQGRLAGPLSAALLAILGVLFSYTTPRQGRFAKLFAAILLYIAYSNLLAIGQSWIARGVTPGWLGLWWVHGLALMMILGLMLKRSGVAWLRIVLSPGQIVSRGGK